MEEDRERGELRGYRFVSNDSNRRLYISTRGYLIYYKGGDEHQVTLDKEVKALGAATKKGAPVREVPAYEKLAAELKPITVRAKLKMTANDASNLTKVTEAFEKAEAAMFVRYQHPGKDGSVARMVVTPRDVSGAGYGGNDYGTDEDEAKRHKKLAKHGGLIYGYSSPETPQGNHIKVSQKKSSELADKTPGILWDIDGTTAVFVSLDGGRYEVSLSQSSSVTAPVIVKGAGPENAWPKPVTDTFLDMTQVSQLEKAGAVPATTMPELDKIDGEWTACTAKGWVAATKKFDAGRMNTGKIKAEIKKLHTGCNKHIDKFETVIVKFIEDRAKARAAVFAKASARAKSVGANK
ncbi:MAG: hypothetical protein H0T42_16975 [Deltaproteobacteria bacterium]|nr:hypothetical protein [Deltaproteobacteria bacterium]